MVPLLRSIANVVLIGIKRSMTRVDDATPELWREFMPRRGEITNRVGVNYYSLQDYSMLGGRPPMPHETFVKWAAVEARDAANIPDGMSSYTIHGGLYAVFTHRGPASEFRRTFTAIFDEWLPSSEYTLDDREHFEVLGPTYRPDDPNAEEEIWIPIRSIAVDETRGAP